jgi:hypothetical protein
LIKNIARRGAKEEIDAAGAEARERHRVMARRPELDSALEIFDADGRRAFVTS